MLKRSIAFAAFSTTFAVGLVSTVVAAPQSLVSNLTNTNANTRAITRSIPMGVSTSPPVIVLAQVTNVNLTGKWQGNDGGTYYLRQIGDQLWWYGERSATNPGWSNVFKGTIQGNLINGSWADVPKGNILSSGYMTIQIVSPDRLSSISKTGNFGGSVWTRFGSGGNGGSNDDGEDPPVCSKKPDLPQCNP